MPPVLSPIAFSALQSPLHESEPVPPSLPHPLRLLGFRLLPGLLTSQGPCRWPAPADALLNWGQLTLPPAPVGFIWLLCPGPDARDGPHSSWPSPASLAALFHFLATSAVTPRPRLSPTLSALLLCLILACVPRTPDWEPALDTAAKGPSTSQINLSETDQWRSLRFRSSCRHSPLEISASSLPLALGAVRDGPCGPPCPLPSHDAQCPCPVGSLVSVRTRWIAFSPAGLELLCLPVGC